MDAVAQEILFFKIRKKQNCESLASALLMKKLLALDISLLLFISFLRSSGKSSKHLQASDLSVFLFLT